MNDNQLKKQVGGQEAYLYLVSPKSTLEVRINTTLIQSIWIQEMHKNLKYSALHTRDTRSRTTLLPKMMIIQVTCEWIKEKLKCIV